MFRSVSSKVFPVVTQPGRSGTYAAQLCSARSKMTAYFRLIFLPPDPRPSGWISKFPWVIEIILAYNVLRIRAPTVREGLPRTPRTPHLRSVLGFGLGLDLDRK